MHVDYCGKWNANYKHSATLQNVKHQILLFTIVNEAIRWHEICQLLNHTVKAATKCLDKYWFCHYPQPRKVIYNNGSEFLGYNFQKLLNSYSIKGHPKTVKNPQAKFLIK